MKDQSFRIDRLSREVYFSLKSDKYAEKIFKLFSVLEFQGGCVRLNITINHSNMRGAHMEKST